MLTITGSLLVGVEFNEETHCDFELREQLVKDSVDIFDNAKNSARATANDGFYAVCLLAKRIVRLGDIPAESISPELLLGMHQVDFNELTKAAHEIEERRRRFRETPVADAANDGGAT